MTSQATATALEDRLRRARIVPVVRTGDPAEAESIVERLLAAGLDAIELTTTIPGWPDAVAAVRAAAPEACVGVGTILDEAQAHEAVRARPDFCVSPCLVPAARGALASAGIPFVEGGLTPTEVLDAASRGIAKLFPAHVGGPRYLRSLLAVAPGARIVPTGGIPLAEVGAWIAAGAVAVGVGADLTAPGDVGARVREALTA